MSSRPSSARSDGSSSSRSFSFRAGSSQTFAERIAHLPEQWQPHVKITIARFYLEDEHKDLFLSKLETLVKTRGNADNFATEIDLVAWDIVEKRNRALIGSSLSELIPDATRKQIILLEDPKDVTVAMGVLREEPNTPISKNSDELQLTLETRKLWRLVQQLGPKKANSTINEGIQKQVATVLKLLDAKAPGEVRGTVLEIVNVYDSLKNTPCFTRSGSSKSKTGQALENLTLRYQNFWGRA